MTVEKYKPLLKKDQTGRIEIFVDGSCSFNGSPKAIAGIRVWLNDDNPFNISKTLEQESVTNVVADIQAVIEACFTAIEFNLKRIKILMDSEYLINFVKKYIEKWKKNGWKYAKRKPVANQDLLQQLDIIMRKIDVKFEFMEGHKGIYGNEKADQLAKNGARISQQENFSSNP